MEKLNNNLVLVESGKKNSGINLFYWNRTENFIKQDTDSKEENYIKGNSIQKNFGRNKRSRDKSNGIWINRLELRVHSNINKLM